MVKRILSILLYLTPVAVAAQPADSLTRVLDRFNTGAAIRINESRGHFFGLKDGAVVFEGENNIRNIPLSDVSEVWTQKSHFKSGAVTGAIIGGIPLAALGALFVGVACENSDTHCRGDYPVAIAYGLVIGGTGGALIGGLIGYAIKRWDRVY